MARIPGLTVVRSSVHGYGVISTRKRRRGSVVANVEGVLWTADEQRDDTYSLIIQPGVFFDMVDQTRWINHSCEPNIEVLAELTRTGGAWAQFQALRDIEAGEELFYDYGFAQEVKEPCACRASTCRGWIVEKPSLELVRKTA